MQLIELSKIEADENQPRKLFPAEKQKHLQDSIKQHGIVQPLIVQEVSKGKYLLVDGERRYRAAQFLKLAKVPVLVEKPQNATERKVRQFNIQEQHEAWSPVEKAVAIVNLAEELGVSVHQMCRLLHIASHDVIRYSAFATIVDKEGWVRSEIPLDYAQPLKTLQNRVRTIVQDELDEEYSRTDEKRFENRIVHLIKTGTIVKRHDLTKLNDSFTKNPKLIKKFLSDAKATPVSLFSESKAKGAYHLRNAMYAATYIFTHGHAFLELRDVKLTPENLESLKKAQGVIKELIDVAE